MAQDIPAGWDGILDPGETILWQDRAIARFDWRLLLNKQSLSGLGFAAFAVFWIFQAMWIGRMMPGGGLGDGFGGSSSFPLFGIPFVLVGLYMVLGKPVLAYLRLRGSHYTLTDRHAFIATQTFGLRGLERYPLTAGLMPALEDGDPGAVWFAHATGGGGWQGRGAGGDYAAGARESRIGFQSIRDARHVFRLFLDAQTALAKPASPAAEAPISTETR